MKSHTEYLTFNVPARMGFVNITQQCEEAVRKSGVQEGMLLCNAMHITASVFINDNEAGLHQDYKDWLEQLAPFDASPQRYRHNRTGEDNADAHMKRQTWGGKWSWRSPRESWILGRGSRSFTANSTGGGPSACS